MKVGFSRSALALVVCAGSLLACGAEADGDRRVSKLREELARVQADRDRVDQRLIALENQVTSTPAETKVEPPRPVQTPSLRVVRLGADGAMASEVTSAEETAAATDDDGGSAARPVLRVLGSPRGRGRGAERAKADVITQTLPPEEPVAGAPNGLPSIRERAPRPSALDPEARRAYDESLALVRNKQCQKALDAFAGFIVRWPDHPNADNAMYWRGECYAELGDLPRAIEQFEGTIARFPLGNKAPDAMLKLGISYTKLGNQARAKEAFERLDREYPRSEARRRIPQGAVSTP